MRSLRDEARDVALLESDPLTRQLVARALGGTRPVVVVDHIDELWQRAPAELARTLVLCSTSDAQLVGAEALAALARGIARRRAARGSISAVARALRVAAKAVRCGRGQAVRQAAHRADHPRAMHEHGAKRCMNNERLPRSS
jgi:hypothetical protein